MFGVVLNKRSEWVSGFTDGGISNAILINMILSRFDESELISSRVIVGDAIVAVRSGIQIVVLSGIWNLRVKCLPVWY